MVKNVSDKELLRSCLKVLVNDIHLHWMDKEYPLTARTIDNLNKAILVIQLTEPNRAEKTRARILKIKRR